MALVNVRFARATQIPSRKVSAGTANPKLINGNVAYSGAPALVQTTDAPMANAILIDRFTSVWGVPAAVSNNGSDTIIEIDLGSSKTIAAGGILGWSPLGALSASNFGIEYLPGTVYATSGWISTAPMIFSLFAAPRDNGGTFTPISARFWRFRFTGTATGSGFFLSSVFLTTALTDLGFLYSRGDETIVTPKTIVEGYGGVPTVTLTGGTAKTYRRWSLDYQNIDPATRAIFDQLNGEATPFLFFTPEDRVFECFFDGTDFNRANIWNPPDRYAFTPSIRSMP